MEESLQKFYDGDPVSSETIAQIMPSTIGKIDAESWKI
jgi:hypothetical protein